MKHYDVELSSWTGGYMRRKVEATSMDDAVAKVLEEVKPEERYAWREKSVRSLPPSVSID